MLFEKSIFVFRRDLRLQDNLALLEAAQRSKIVYPFFFLDPRQVAPHPYRSESGLQFMLASLHELAEELRSLHSALHLVHGNPEEELPRIAPQNKIQAIFCSSDYTPFSIKRDQQIRERLKSHSIDFFATPNILLHEPGQIKNLSGKPYTVYTYFAKASALKSIAKPSSTIPANFGRLDGITNMQPSEAVDRYLGGSNKNLRVKGGRKEALNMLSKMSNFKDYDKERNFPAMSATTYLSAHNKFGTVSIREVYSAIVSEFGPQHTLCKELYWRDFFTHIGKHFPHVFKGAFHQKYDRLAWDDNEDFLFAWQEGQTGFPIVDAGMRELNTTGYMHNRVRMIVASFITKDLLLDWHHGERYFAKKLVDYDPAVNNGNWQWAASTGCDAQPYFRIFNPWLQAEKFDKEAEYIKRWVPELEPLSAKEVHKLYKSQSKRPKNYPAPIVDHDEQRVKARRMFELARER